MSATELALHSSVASADSSDSVAGSQQHYNLALNWSSHSVIVASLVEVLLALAAPRGGTRRHLEEGRELCAEPAAPSQQHQLRRNSRSRRR